MRNNINRIHIIVQFRKKEELITVFVSVVCQKSLVQSISLEIAISVPVVSLS
ncbi:hypothetical protein Hanom_Chr05g00388581 [Helianthus anomalus]